MTKEEAIESFKRSVEKDKARLEVIKERNRIVDTENLAVIKEIEFYIKRNEMAIKVLENHDTFMKYAYSYGKADALSQEPCKDIEEIAEVIKCDADAETKCKMISNILTAKPHYFKVSQEPTSEMVHVETLHQIMWERDIAIEQLHELGYEWGQKIEPCDDAISRQAVLDIVNSDWKYEGLETDIASLPSVTQKSGKCKNCKYFEYDSIAKVDGIPLIVAHEICNKWGDGCKTKEDGYCFLFEPQESEE